MRAAALAVSAALCWPALADPVDSVKRIHDSPLCSGATFVGAKCAKGTFVTCESGPPREYQCVGGMPVVAGELRPVKERVIVRPVVVVRAPVHHSARIAPRPHHRQWTLLNFLFPKHR